VIQVDQFISGSNMAIVAARYRLFPERDDGETAGYVIEHS
jgi:hypothetical protein